MTNMQHLICILPPAFCQFDQWPSFIKVITPSSAPQTPYHTHRKEVNIMLKEINVLLSNWSSALKSKPLIQDLILYQYYINKGASLLIRASARKGKCYPYGLFVNWGHYVATTCQNASYFLPVGLLQSQEWSTSSAVTDNMAGCAAPNKALAAWFEANLLFILPAKSKSPSSLLLGLVMWKGGVACTDLPPIMWSPLL